MPTPNLDLDYLEVGGSAVVVMNENLDKIDAAAGAGASGVVIWSGDISPSQLVANTDNYNPAGLSGAAILRLSTDASRDLTGIAGGADGRVLLLLNIGSFPLVLKDDATSTAANRFQLNGDVTIGADEGVSLWYDSTSSRWRMSARYTSLASLSTLTVTQSFTLSGDISPAQLTANTDDYAPTGLSTATILRLSTDASRDLTGITGGADGRTLLVLNVGANPLVLKDDATSTAGNRFQLDGDLTLQGDDAVLLWYDSTSSRWRAAAVYRRLPSVLSTETVTFSGDISPTQIAANTNDYAPTGLATATVLRLSTDASRDLTGITGGADGRILLVLNVGSNPLVLKDNVTSSAANRFMLNGDVTLNHDEGVLLWYDSTLSFWRMLGLHALASTTLSGNVELATAAETTTGTDATRAVTPDSLAHSDRGKVVIGILVSDPQGSAISTGDGKAYVRIPSTVNGMNLVTVAASVSTVSSSGIPTVQLRRVRSGTPADMLTTKLTIDASETDSSTAATAAVIDTSNDDVQTADQVHIDIDVSGTGAKGLFVEMQFQLP